MLTCKDAIEIMGDYLEASLGPELVAALEQHFQDCPPCVAYLNTYRKTRELTGRVGRVEMPEEMKQRLRQFLIERLGRQTSS